MTDDGFVPGRGIPGLVSVIIPSYNRANILGETLDSVLAQSYTEFEAIVVDDGSTDRTPDVVAEYTDPRVRYFYKPNGGLSSARNFGLQLARGEFIAFLDSDDCWRSWKLSAQIEIFRRHPEVGLVWSDMSTFATAGEILAERHLKTYYSAYGEIDFETNHRAKGSLATLASDMPASFAKCHYYVVDIFHQMFSGNLVHPPTAIVRRERLQQSGPFEPEVTGCGAEDYHFYFRISSHGPVAFLDAPSTLYRVHAAQMSTWNRLHEARGNLSVVQHWLTRRPENLPKSRLQRRLAASHAWLGAEELQAGNARNATRHLWRSLRLHVRQPYIITLLFLSLLPQGAAGILRTSKRAVATLITRPFIAILVMLSNDQEMFFRMIALFQPDMVDI